MPVKFNSNLGKTTRSPSTDREFNTPHHLPPCTLGLTVPKQPLLSPLRWSEHKLWKKDGTKSTVGRVIADHPITLLMFGSPCYHSCYDMVQRLKELQHTLEVVYIPVYTYQEHPFLVERDFYNNHGDWWTMGYQTMGAVEAVYSCGVAVLPSLVVVDCQGVVVTDLGQRDLTRWGNSAVIAWS